MRAFVALEIPRELREALARFQEELRAVGLDVRWTPSEQIHLTLKFLGEIEEARVDPLRRDLEAGAARHPAPRLQIVGIGAFPEQGPPRVVWAGCRGLDPGIADAVDVAAARQGVLRESRAFVPHLTLGRVKAAGRLREAIGAARERRFGRMAPKELVLFRSTLRPSGAVHEAVARIPFRGSGG